MTPTEYRARIAAKRKPTEPQVPWSTVVRCRLSQTEAILWASPKLAHIVRPEPHGIVVARFILPLELCKPQNRKRAPTRGAGFLEAKTRRSILSCLTSQARPFAEPLPGRPQVLCVRFSSSEPDRYSDWAKVSVDCLCAPTERSPNRLGIIRDDAPRFAEIEQWWEPAPRGDGWVYVEVRSGTP